MANTKSARKRIRKTKKQTQLNLVHKNRIKAIKKSFKKDILSGDKENAQKNYPKYCSFLDKAAKRNIIHKNKAARLKSNASKLLKTILF